MKTAANYIETVYGTNRFARSLVCHDANSLMDLMQDFSDFNNQVILPKPMIQITEQDAEKFLNRLECLISATAIFPRLASELKVLQSIERDAKILLGKDVTTEIEKLISKLNS